jgi:heptosyltransferase-2
MAAMETFDIEAYIARSRALDLTGIDWDAVPRHPLPPAAVRALRYMQDVESHTIVYLRTLLQTRAVDDDAIATFLGCWLYEETFHGRALARFLGAAGHAPRSRPARSRPTPRQALRARATALLARAWPGFVAVHMTWGAINELTTWTGYRRLAALAGHPVLAELLGRIMRDERRHFAFYCHEAARRLREPRTARITRALVDRFWAPVGSGEQPAAETRFLAGYLFAGAAGRGAARRVDERIRRLPGFAGVALLEAWIDGAPTAAPARPAPRAARRPRWRPSVPRARTAGTTGVPQLRAGAAPASLLVKASNWLGDVVLGLPALRAVRRAFPEARLAVLVRGELASFFDGSTWIDEVLPYAARGGVGRLLVLPGIVRTLRARRFDTALLFPTSFESALWPGLAGVPRRIGYGGDGRGALLTTRVRPTGEIEGAHEVHWYLHLVRSALGVDGPADAVAPDVHPPHRARVDAWLAARRRRRGPLVALAPAAAYGPAKEWPAASWGVLVDLLAERHAAECVLVGAPSERARCEEVAGRCRAGALVAAGETSVGELVALLARADGFAGNDSGAMHVAGALGRPTVGVFGSTAPARTSPLGARTRVLYEGVACSPCLARTCRYGSYDCLARIPPEAVLGALRDLGAVA